MALSEFWFVGLDDLKPYVGAEGSGQDQNLEGALAAAHTALELRTGREWVTRGSKTELHSIRGRRERIRLSQFPCKTVTSVHESTSWPRVFDSTTLLVDGTDYLYDAQLGELRRVSGGALICWPSGERTVQVVRIAGFTSPLATADLAGAFTRAEALVALAELAQLVKVMAAGMFKEGDIKGWGESSTQNSAGFAQKALAYLTPAQLDQLDSYRSIDFGERTWEIAAA